MLGWEDLSPEEQAAACYWDVYKEVHGIRPRHVDTSSWNLSDFRREFDLLHVVAERQRIERLREEELAIHDLEMKILNLMGAGAKTRAMAIHWLMEANDVDGDADFLCYKLGVPYCYFDGDVE
jgi:hypothetical protein